MKWQVFWSAVAGKDGQPAKIESFRLEVEAEDVDDAIEKANAKIATAPTPQQFARLLDRKIVYLRNENGEIWRPKNDGIDWEEVKIDFAE